MCGIVGYANKNGAINIQEMMDAIAHRGPDDQGKIVFNTAGLGFKRLSIIDVSAGKQPFVSSDGQTACVVNGEIYNHVELREELHRLGCTFLSKSDGEVVLNGYLAWGNEVFSKLKGMFATAIFDNKTQSLLLARDPLGKKPLYWTQQSGEIRFASEIKGLCVKNLEVNAEAVLSYLTTDSIPTPLSIYENIFKLEPGSFLTMSPGNEIKISKFWAPDIQEETTRTAAEWLKDFDLALNQSVKRRLMSDVPLGVFLSSGVDSTLVASYASKLATSQLDSFTLKFEDSSYDESQLSQKIAKYFGFNHHEIVASTNEIKNQTEKAAFLLDEPVNDPAALVQILLAEHAAPHVKVALTGDGGDELFYGYGHIRAHELFESHNLLAQGIKSISGILNKVPDSGGYFSAGFKAQRLSRGLATNDLLSRDIAWRGAFTSNAAEHILSPEMRNRTSFSQILMRNEAIFRESNWATTPLGHWSWWYLRTYLMDTVLVKVDRATMGFGVEARSPLLDQDLVSLALSMPLDLKTGKYRGKQFLKDLLRKVSPGLVLSPTKHGMGVPTSELMKNHFKAEITELTDATYIKTQGIFNSKSISLLVENFYSGKKDLRKELWGIFVFQLWWEKWGKSLVPTNQERICK